MIINTEEWLTSSSAQRSTSATTWRLGGGESTAWRSAVKPVAFGSEGDASNIYLSWVKAIVMQFFQDNGSCFGLCYSMLSLYCFVLVGCFGKLFHFPKPPPHGMSDNFSCHYPWKVKVSLSDGIKGLAGSN